MKSDNSRYMPRKDYLKAVFTSYEDKSTDYLLALRDALTLMILSRCNPSAVKPLEEYEGYIKYV